jgi:hypothetical protein
MTSAGTLSIVLQSQKIRPLSRQSATEAIMKNIPTFIITQKPNGFCNIKAHRLKSNKKDTKSLKKSHKKT